MSQVVELLEYTRVSKARRIDEAAGTLFDLVALGPSSANGRDYPESTMRAALPLFEGKQSFADHDRQGDPSVYHVLGVWQNCRVEEGRVRGDFAYFKSHPLAPRLVEAARRPELHNALGFSINAHGRTADRGGRQVVEALTSLTSIDLVARAATAKGLYESRGLFDSQGGPMRSTVRKLLEYLDRHNRRFARALREVAEAGVMSADAPAEAPPDGDEPADHEAALRSGFEAAWTALFNDDSLDSKGKLAKAKMILDSLDKLVGTAGGGAGDDVGTEESRRRGHAGRGRLLTERFEPKPGEIAALGRWLRG